MHLSRISPSIFTVHPTLLVRQGAALHLVVKKSSPPTSEIDDLPGSGASDVLAKLYLKKKKPRFVKSPKDHTPLPNPFPLPRGR